MRELDHHQQLHERVVFERDAFLHPPLGDGQQLRKEPGLGISLFVAEVFFQRPAGQQKRDFVRAALFQVVERVGARLADDRVELDLRRQVFRRKDEPGVGIEDRLGQFKFKVT